MFRELLELTCFSLAGLFRERVHAYSGNPSFLSNKNETSDSSSQMTCNGAYVVPRNGPGFSTYPSVFDHPACSTSSNTLIEMNSVPIKRVQSSEHPMAVIAFKGRLTLTPDSP